MPALPAVPLVCKVIIKQKLGNDVDVINILHWAFTTPNPTSAQLVTAANAIVSAYSSDIVPDITSEMLCESVEIIDLSSSTGSVGISTAPSNVGSLVTPPLSAGACTVESYQIARRYRGGHPRTYWGGNVAAQLTDAQDWTGAYLTTKQGDLNAFYNAVGVAFNTFGGMGGQVNVSYYSGFTNHTYPSGRVRAIPTLRGTPLVDFITGRRINPKVGSQRRRNLQA